jgi:hypothetical protein
MESVNNIIKSDNADLKGRGSQIHYLMRRFSVKSWEKLVILLLMSGRTIPDHCINIYKWCSFLIQNGRHGPIKYNLVVRCQCLTPVILAT